MSAARRITLCADDFGFSAAACRSILALAEAGALSATSCAVDGAAMADHAAPLRDLRRSAATGRLGVGLHLNLTENPAFAGSQPLQRWLRQCFLRRPQVHSRRAQQALRAELARQFDRFEHLLQQAPDHVDGHEHVHQFPGLRPLLIELLQQRYGVRVPVRCTVPRVWRGTKAAIIAGLGGRALQRQLRAAGLAGNTDFAGVYDLQATRGYAARLQGWLKSLADGGVVMCHPEDGPGASPARQHEHDVLASAAWVDLRLREQVTLAAQLSAG
jgi:chitin disaccharide deacetylase